MTTQHLEILTVSLKKPLLLALSLLAASAAAPLAQTTDERLCLMDYAMARREDPTAALVVLSKCAEQFPESYQINRTLGKKLATQGEADANTDTLSRAVHHFQIAAKLKPGKFAELYGRLAGLQTQLGRPADAIESWEMALPYLTSSERQETENKLWTLYLDAGQRDEALELWDKISYRFGDDETTLMAAASLLLELEHDDRAKDLYKEISDKWPENAGAKKAYQDLVSASAGSGGTSEKREYIRLQLAELGEADDEKLEQLIVLCAEVLMTKEALLVAEECLKRHANHPMANAWKATALYDDGDESAALAAARRAFKGELSEDFLGRLHEMAGRIIEKQTLRRYNAAGSQTDAKTIRAALTGYDNALSHYRKAAKAGADTDREIANARSARGPLKEALRAIDAKRLRAERRLCEDRSQSYSADYDQSKAQLASATNSVSLMSTADGDSQRGTLSAGESAQIMLAEWADDVCWLKLKTTDSTTGWAPDSKLKLN